MSHRTPDSMRVLHTVRVLGYADSDRIAARTGLSTSTVDVHLQDAQARGWVSHTAFAGDHGWSVTERGKTHGEALVAGELDEQSARAVLHEVHDAFVGLNEVVVAACTSWQLTEMGIGPKTVELPNVIAALADPAVQLRDLEDRLTSCLDRFEGYSDRFTAALDAAAQDPTWLTAMDRDSCHRVWFELHEDLIATLGLRRD